VTAAAAAGDEGEERDEIERFEQIRPETGSLTTAV